MIFQEANINQAVALVRLVDPTRAQAIDYLLIYLNSDTVVDQMLESRVITAQANISLADVNGFTTALTSASKNRARLLEALLQEVLVPVAEAVSEAEE